MKNAESGWFGFEAVTPDDKTQKVRDVFQSVAGKYDIMNDLMSFGLHRAWKKLLIEKIAPSADMSLLDVAGGTGDITAAFLKAGGGQAMLTDINPAMLDAGRTRFADMPPARLQIQEANAEQLPFEDCKFDTVTITFGLRNVTRIDTALTEFHRVLKPGGRFFCMEFSPAPLPILKTVYDRYSFSILPWLGEKIAKDRAAYQYLAESIRQFPAPDVLTARMKQAGFDKVTTTSLTGGIVTLHTGWRF
jgi:demethylmenaquinone methyltransferase / 2-methoxy-6-polyprenyl-1,4-benzoquinol methylase